MFSVCIFLSSAWYTKKPLPTQTLLSKISSNDSQYYTGKEQNLLDLDIESVSILLILLYFEVRLLIIV